MKKRKNKHNKPIETDTTLEIGVVSPRLCQDERILRARLFAKKTFKEATGRDIPLECFKVTRDESGDFIVTIDETNKEATNDKP